MLGLGKVSREVLRRSVFPFIPLEEEPVLDGGMVQLSGRTIVAHSPSIGVPLDALVRDWKVIINVNLKDHLRWEGVEWVGFPVL